MMETAEMDTEMKVVIFFHAQFQSREQPTTADDWDAKLERLAQSAINIRCTVPPWQSTLPFRLPLANACRVPQPRRSSPAMARQDGLGLGSVSFRHDETPPNPVECLLFSFSWLFPP